LCTLRSGDFCKVARNKIGRALGGIPLGLLLEKLVANYQFLNHKMLEDFMISWCMSSISRREADLRKREEKERGGCMCVSAAAAIGLGHTSGKICES